MQISPIQNYGYKNTYFKGNKPVNDGWRERYEPAPGNNNSRKGMPEWLRKGALFWLVALAVAHEPATQEYLKPENVKQQEKELNEYFKDASELKYPLSHHLSRLADVDKPIIVKHNNNNYRLKFNLDNNKETVLDVNISKNNPDVLYGAFKTDNRRFVFYKAVFNPKNPDELEIRIRNSQNKKYIIGRKPNGELYKLEKGKKIVLNSENAKRYQDEIKMRESLNDFEFFTTNNDELRKLNLILLFFLTINEWKHDIKMRKKEEESNNK